MFNIKLTYCLLVFSLSFCFISPTKSQKPIELVCNGTPKTETIFVSGIQSKSTDSLEAVREYAKHAASSTKAICVDPDKCTGLSECVKVCIGINASGSFPAPTKTPLGYWRFPDKTVTVYLQCVCQSTATIFEVEDVYLDDIPFDPFIGNGNDENDNSAIRKFSRNLDILVYPNPVRSDLKVEFKDFGKSGNYTIKIFNSMGAVMEAQEVNISKQNPYTHTINASDYVGGVYYVLISDDTEIVTTTRFVVAD